MGHPTLVSTFFAKSVVAVGRVRFCVSMFFCHALECVLYGSLRVPPGTHCRREGEAVGGKRPAAESSKWPGVCVGTGLQLHKHAVTAAGVIAHRKDDDVVPYCHTWMDRCLGC